MPPLLRKLIVPILIAVVIGGLLYYQATRPVIVDTASVTKGPARYSVEEEGKTRVVDRYVISAPVSGRLYRVEIEEGEAVEKGAVVAEMDPLSLTTRLAEAAAGVRGLLKQLEGVDRKRPKQEEIDRSRVLEEAADGARQVAEKQLAEAQAVAEQAKREAVRAVDLVANQTISPSEKETAELEEIRAAAALEAAEKLLQIREIEVRAAKLATRILEESSRDVDWEEAWVREQVAEVEAGLAVVRDDLTRAALKAPVSGRVLRRFIESESVIAAGTPVVEIGDTENLEVEADLLSEEVAHMREGMKVEIFGRALGNKVVQGKIKRIYPAAFEKISSLGVEQQRVTVLTTFPAEGLNLGDRYRVDVRVILEEKQDVLRVPEAALFREKGELRAMLLDGGRLRKVTVTTGIRDEGFREVLEGLAESDRVVLNPHDDLEDGARAKQRDE